MIGKTLPSGWLPIIVVLISFLTTSSAKSITITKDNWNLFLKDHPIALVLCFSSTNGPSMLLKEDLGSHKHVLAFENSGIDIGYLDVHEHPDVFPKASTAAEIPFVSFYFKGKHHIMNKPGLTVGSS
jgi:hypothetical protein